MTQFCVKAVGGVAPQAVALPACADPYCRGGEVQYPEWEGRTEVCWSCTEFPVPGDVLVVVDTCPTCDRCEKIKRCDHVIESGSHGYGCDRCGLSGTSGSSWCPNGHGRVGLPVPGDLVPVGYVTAELLPVFENVDDEPDSIDLFEIDGLDGPSIWRAGSDEFPGHVLDLAPEGVVPGGSVLILTPVPVVENPEMQSGDFLFVTADGTMSGLIGSHEVHDLPPLGSPVSVRWVTDQIGVKL